MSYRDDEELLAERGAEVSYEAISRWVNKFENEYAKPQLILLFIDCDSSYRILETCAKLKAINLLTKNRLEL